MHVELTEVLAREPAGDRACVRSEGAIPSENIEIGVLSSNRTSGKGNSKFDWCSFTCVVIHTVMWRSHVEVKASGDFDLMHHAQIRTLRGGCKAKIVVADLFAF